ncbi:DJ-1/PfpI family protein [Clostridium sp. HBUAS56017]|uniref:DJ-1/PfpI family protein n=1 Tax=Clostridium sp. HBUAS56017 TaxID=2571128 RepID=UPI0011775BE5|nr:DJ-1/PfpI family protein [Clostridium sp. HBUAS56017]
MTKKILLLLGDYTEDYETMVPYILLKTLGYEVHTVCPDKKAGDYVKTAIHDFEGDQTYTEKRGHNFVLNKDFTEVCLGDYDGLYISGGRSPEYLRNNEDVVNIAKYFLTNSKPIAAICHGPQILVATGMLRGRKLTAYPSVAPEIRACGAEYIEVQGDNAVVDENLVTSPSWAAHTSILSEFLILLGAKIKL